MRPEGFYFGACFEEVDDSEEKETVPDTVEHPDHRNTGEDKEQTEAGEAVTDQAEDEQFEECSTTGSCKELAHAIARAADAL